MVSPVDKARWPALSPLIDELLDLEPTERAARLAQLRDTDPALAGELQALLNEMSALEHSDFLDSPALLAAPARLDGMHIGAYTVERELGQGGMGSVWLARRTDGRFEGLAAIKFINANVVARGGAERFAREGSILARLSHPNIARLLDAGVARDGTLPYLVLEYIDGQPIDRHCDAHALDTTARVRLFLDVLAAVTHAHNRLILHRDLKPSNILVTPAGEVKLLDFGIAKLLDANVDNGPDAGLTAAVGRVFTPRYAAPEQLRGDDVTTATDVYALGVLLHLLLAGSHPTEDPTAGALDQMRAVVEAEPRRLSDSVTGLGPDARRRARELRGDLDNIVARALKKAPAERYANAALLADDLRRHLRNEPVTARPDRLTYRATRFVQRHRVGVAAGSLVVLALSAGLGVARWEANEAQRQRVQAEGLIEFMLGDLRKQLQPVGRLDALDGVGKRALSYYADQETRDLDAASLGRRARALHLIGEIADQRGRHDEALPVFRTAADSTAALLARAPNDGQRVFEHAQSLYWVGYIARQRGDLPAAEAAFRDYQALAQRLVQLDPQQLDWRAEVPYASGNLGIVQLESGRHAAALQAFDEARLAWTALVGTRPDFGIELANIWGWIAKAREALGEHAAAITAQQAKAEVLRGLPGAAQDREVQRLLANASYELGRLPLLLGQPERARIAAQAALDQYGLLVAADPDNIEWLSQHSYARVGLAEAELALGRRDAAQAQLVPLGNAITRLLAADANRAKWTIALRGSQLLLGLALGSPDAARPQVEAYLAAVQRAQVEGRLLDAEQTRIASAVQLALAELPGLARDQAETHRRAVVERLSGRAAAGELPAATLVAQAHWQLGAAADARALAARVEASTYRHPAYLDLRQRLANATGAASAP